MYFTFIKLDGNNIISPEVTTYAPITNKPDIQTTVSISTDLQPIGGRIF